MKPSKVDDRARMLPVMTAKADGHARLAHHGVRVRLPDGRKAIVYSRISPGGSRVVIVKPTKE